MQLGLPDTGILDGPLGLVTDGLLGLTASLDPAFVPVPVPAAVGGSLLAGRRDGVWLLDFDIAGQRYRFGTREVSVRSRDQQTTHAFVAGMSDPAPSIDVETLSVRVTSDHPWSALRDRIGPFTGRDFVLRYWYEGQYLEDAFIVLQGCISGASFAEMNSPVGLALDLRRSDEALSTEVVSIRETVSEVTWGTDGPALIPDPALIGVGYPIVIGHPGGFEAGGPALYVDGTDHYVMVAGHPVQATDVTIVDKTGGGSASAPVFTMRDGRNRLVSMADLGGTGLTVAFGRAYYAGYDTTTGGGVLDNGRVVTGLGDLLIWGSKNFSRAVFDLGEMEAQRTDLNLYRIDTVINQVGMFWEDWIKQNLFALFNLEVVNGPRGVFYRQMKYHANIRGVRANLAADAGYGGIRVQRTSELTETTEDIFNRVTIQYAPVGMSSSSYGGSLTIGATRDATTDQIPDRICAKSVGYFGVRPKTINTLVTFDRATAYRLGRDAVLRYAMPKITATYVGGTDLFALRKWETVQVQDTTAGAAFNGALAVVTGIRFGAANTAYVSLLFPGDLQWL